MKKEHWNSSLGAILAVAGSAVGLGNFLKFPGQVATYGGAAFMIAYVISFFLVGLPLSMAEWGMGKASLGKRHSVPWIFNTLKFPKPFQYISIIAILVPFVIYSYYVYIESWCLGYSVNFLLGFLDFKSVEESTNFFSNFVGLNKDGSAFSLKPDSVMFFFVAVFIINFYLIYKGIAKGIEWFCKITIPLLIVLAIILVIRIMTLGLDSETEIGSRINEGLGFMWNPTKVELQTLINNQWIFTDRLVSQESILHATKNLSENQRIIEIGIFQQLLNPSLWIAAVGQVFFSLSVGMAVIATYASYLKKRDDVVLSCLTSTAANEFCEVCLGGLITVPAAVALFGVSSVVGACSSLFSLGFNVLPVFFSNIGYGNIFGFLFFFLLFLASITSSISMLQPSLAFMEETMNMTRRNTTLLLSILTTFLSGISIYFSEGLKALDTMDFWAGQVFIYIIAMIEIILLSWNFGATNLLNETNKFSIIKLPKIYTFIWKFVTPSILGSVFLAWLAKDVFGLFGGNLSYHISNLFITYDKVSWICMMSMISIFLFLLFIFITNKQKDEK